jgi:superfamily II DNA or RNA helicase
MRSWKNLRLWPDQFQALERCRAYLNNPQKSALIQMPTGAGKTGVIAVVAMARAPEGISLVLSPSEALVDQLRRDIAEGFWATINAPPSWRPSRVELLLPSHSTELAGLMADRGTSRVLVGTFQALQQIQAQDAALYTSLGRRIATVLVDEGHREPAESWARAVRSLNQPTILFSATPYRNDERLFDVSPTHTYFLSFANAVASQYIRDVRFIELATDESADNFATAVSTRFKQLLHADAVAADAKVIVRAAEYDNVHALFNAFRQVNVSDEHDILAFHERFDGSVPGKLSQVPNLRIRNERYLIHQYKLLEGIDEPRCAVLALYQDFTNARQLVQQIGRIIRNPTPLQAPRHRAIVLIPPWSDAKTVWNSYKDYDSYCATQGGTSLTRERHIVQQMLGQLPEIGYLGGGFRRRMSFDDENLLNELVVPRSCVIFSVAQGFSMATFGEELKSALESDDRLIVQSQYLPQQTSWLFLTVAAQESELLAISYFPQLSLHVTVATFSNSRLFFTDTGGLWIDDFQHVGRRLSVDNLRTLFPDHADTRLSRVTARNSDIGPAAIRSRTLSARSLEEAAPFMGDSLHVLSQAYGRVPTAAQRYVGFNRSRVRDGDGSPSPIQMYRSWIRDLDTEISTANQAIGYFERFAAPSAPPQEVLPNNVLLDLGALAGEFRRDGYALEAEDLCADVQANVHPDDSNFLFSFPVTLIRPIGNAQVSVWVRFDRERQRYEIKSPDLSLYSDPKNKRITAVSRLNQEQAFRVIPRDARYFFSGGDFYKIDTASGLRAVRRAVNQLLTAIPALQAIGDEKGNGPGNGVDWSQGSLFAFIDRGLRGPVRTSPFRSRFTSIVCDDSQREAADFIAFTDGEDKRVAFVHAKAHPDAPGTGAGKLYDVCSQASKNLAFVRFGAREVASSIVAWNHPWNLAGYEVAPRIRSGPTPAAQFRNALKAVLDVPNIRREMWIVLGRILSKGNLDQDLGAQYPPPHAVQAAYLLLSVDAACKSVGVELRVFCSP